MWNRSGLSLTALGLIMALLKPGAALAHEATAVEKAELAQLSPQVRSQVEARLNGEQTVRGILDTMLLNNVSLQFASNRVVAVDFDKGVVVAEGKNDQLKLFPFDVVTLEVKK